jgi:hypothetical protein
VRFDGQGLSGFCPVRAIHSEWQGEIRPSFLHGINERRGEHATSAQNPASCPTGKRAHFVAQNVCADLWIGNRVAISTKHPSQTASRLKIHGIG